MKKGKIALLLVFVAIGAAVGGIYVGIPSPITITTHVEAKANATGAFRQLGQYDNWPKWWPGRAAKDAAGNWAFYDGTYCFYIIKTIQNGLIITIKKGEQSWPSTLQIIATTNDALLANWATTLPNNGNPLARINQYRQAKALKKTMQHILQCWQQFISKPTNVYGLQVANQKVQVQYIMSSKKELNHYPTTPEIYTLINDAEKYIASQAATPTDHPMVHITTADSLQYDLQIAIPVNKQISSSTQVQQKWMMKNGNILVSEIRGGNQAIALAMAQMRQYVADHQYTVMALPFESLVSNRLQTKDSSQWITKLYWPVMQGF